MRSRRTVGKRGRLLESVITLVAIAAGALYASASPVQPAGETPGAPGANVALHRCALRKIAAPRQSSCQAASYAGLPEADRATLDQALALTLGNNQAARVTCQGSTQGWTCAGDDWICSCSHLPSGPVCACSSR
jgi:hypothetical protein